MSASRNVREGSYAGWCYGRHRRTRESLKAQLREGPCWYWAGRKVGHLLHPVVMRYDQARRLQNGWQRHYYRQLARRRQLHRDSPAA